MRVRILAPALVTATLISACGGGGDATTVTPVTPVAPAATTSLIGVAAKGPLKSALVQAFKVNDAGTLGDKITEKETDANGGYTLELGTYAGAVQLVVNVIPGKTKSRDEATGLDQTLPDDFKLHANMVVTAAGSSNQIQNASITPFTELANKIAEDSGGLSKANIAAASKLVFDLIGVDPVASQQLDSTVAPPAGATDDQKRYALYNAAISQMATGATASTDPLTRQCFTAAAAAAAADIAGKKIKCATDQIARSVTITPGTGGASATASVNSNLAGLGSALVVASADVKINLTGRTIMADDAEARKLAALAADALAGTPSPIKLVVSAEETSDIAKAKLFFSRLRSNAAALQSAPLETGLGEGVKAFGDAVRTEAAAVTGNTGRVVRLAQIATDLWTAYQGGSSNVNSPAIVGFPGGCTVYQGSFPTRFGGEAGEALQPYVASSVAATSTANAAWVGCSVNQGSTPTANNPVTQYRQTLLFNMSAGTVPATVPYLAITRKRFLDATTGVLMTQNLMAALAGNIGYTLSNGEVSGVKIVGDLPPPVAANGTLLAARYAVNVNGALTQLASGAFQAAFTAGSFAVVPVGASAASLTLDLATDSDTVVVMADVKTNAAQVADMKLKIAATIKTAKGALTGSLLADRVTVDSFGDLQPGHIKFIGSIAAAGTGGTVTTFLTGTLEASNGSTPVISFEGTLTLPNRPTTTLSLSVTETAPETATTPARYTLTGRYAQDAVTVQISGANTVNGNTLTLADSSGVSVSVNPQGNLALVMVSGRQAAVVDKQHGRVVYSDGTFESLT